MQSAAHRYLFFVLLMLGLLSLPQARAETPEAERAGTAVLMNRPLVEFRASLHGAAPEQRARRAERTLNEVLQQEGRQEVKIKPDPLGNAVVMDGTQLFFLTPDDVDPLTDENLDSLTTRTVETLRLIGREFRESRSMDALLKGLAWFAGETLLLLLVVWGLTRSRRWLRGRVLRLTARHAERLQAVRSGLVSGSRFISLIGKMLALGYWSLVLLLIYTWLGTSMLRFAFTRAWGEQLNGFLLESAARILRGILGALPDLLVAGTMFLIAWGVIRALAPLFDGVEQGERSFGWLDAETVRPTRRLLVTAIWIFAVVMAYPYLPGSNSEAFKGMSVLLGLMVSLGASSVVGQAASGLILMYTRTLRRGEYVRIGEHEGTIVEMGMFNTRLRTGRGSEISLPNSLIVSHSTTNYSRAVKGAGYVVDTAVTIGYDTPWRQVEAMLIEAARRTDGILADPRPAVFQTALSDFYPEYTLVCQAIPSAPRPRAEILSELHANIQDVFNEYGVQIMSPHYLGDPASEKIVPPEKWHAAPAKQD